MGNVKIFFIGLLLLAAFSLGAAIPFSGYVFGGF